MAVYLAGLLIVAGVALYVAAPLSGGLGKRRRESLTELELGRWEHEHALAVQGLRDLEFDREMGKLSNVDYAALKATLERHGIEALTAIEKLHERAVARSSIAAVSKPRPAQSAADSASASAAAVPTPPIAAAPASSQGPSPVRFTPWEARRPNVKFCPQCGDRASSSGNFCGDCGAPLRGDAMITRVS